MSTDGRAWRPLLTGALHEEASRCVRDIIEELESAEHLEEMDVSLADGKAGAALLFAYHGNAYDDLQQGRRRHAMAARLVEEAVREVGETPMPPGLYSGYTGVAWAFEHAHGALLSPGEDPIAEADVHLLDELRAPYKGWFGLESGLAGMAVYLRERLPRPSAVRCFTALVARLAELARSPEGLAAWWREASTIHPLIRGRFTKGAYDLGLGNGQPGVLVALACAVEAGIAREQALPLLERGVSWLLKQQLPPPAEVRFPARVAPGCTPETIRGAWAYGDPGVAMSLFVVARAAGRSDWEQQALELARHAARMAPERSGIHAAGIMQGAAGVAHIFNRLFQATGEPVFEEAARAWFRWLLSLRRAGTGLGGFGWKDLPMENEKGLAMGAVGIALVLLSAVTVAVPDWDRVFLMSRRAVPPVASAIPSRFN